MIVRNIVLLLIGCGVSACGGGCGIVTYPAAVLSDRPLSVTGTIQDEVGQRLDGVEISYSASKTLWWNNILEPIGRGGESRTVVANGDFAFRYRGARMSLRFSKQGYFLESFECGSEGYVQQSRAIWHAKRVGWNPQVDGNSIRLQVTLRRQPGTAQLAVTRQALDVRSGAPQSAIMSIQPPQTGYLMPNAAASRPATQPVHSIFLRAPAAEDGSLVINRSTTRVSDRLTSERTEVAGLEIVMSAPDDGLVGPIAVPESDLALKWMREAPAEGYQATMPIPPRPPYYSEEPSYYYVRVGGQYGICRIQGFNSLNADGASNGQQAYRLSIGVTVIQQPAGREMLLPEGVRPGWPN